MIAIPAQYGKHFGDPKYDWAFETVPQKNCNDRAVRWPRGRMLGGSSGINFLVSVRLHPFLTFVNRCHYYTRKAWSIPPSQDIDAWEQLGNPGWNWENFSRSVKKSERLALFARLLDFV